MTLTQTTTTISTDKIAFVHTTILKSLTIYQHFKIQFKDILKI